MINLEKLTCPFCNSKDWRYKNKETVLLDADNLEDIQKRGRFSGVEKVNKIQCNKCGYTAYFDSRKITSYLEDN